MKKTSKLLAMLLSLAMILSVCGVMTVFAGGEYTVKTGTNNMVRIENAAEYRGLKAGVARSYEFNVPADGEYYVILGKVPNAEGKYDVGINVSLSFTQGEAAPQELSYEFNKDMQANTQEPVARFGNNVPMNVTLSAGACKLDITAAADTGIYYIELRDTRLQITGDKQVISSWDFVSGQIDPQHVNQQVGYGWDQAYPSGYTLVGDYLSDTFDQSTTESNRRVRYIHLNNNCNANYNIDVQQAGYYQISTMMSLYTQTFPQTATLAVNVDGSKVSDLSFIKETTDTQPTLIPSRAVYLTQGRHTLQFANNSGCGAYAYYITLEQVDPNKVVKVDDNFTRIEFAKQEGKATLNSSESLSVTKTLDLVGGTYAVFVKKPIEFYGAECVYNVTFSQNGTEASKISVAAGTNTDNKRSGFSYERVGDYTGTTFTVPDGSVDFTFAVSKDCDVEYIDLRRLDLPLTGGKQAIAVADFSYIDQLSPAHCSQQFGSGKSSHVLLEYPVIGDYFSNKVTPAQKYFPIHLSQSATVGYTVDVAQAGWYQFGVVINTYKSNGMLTLYADDNLIDSVTYSYTTDPQPDLTYTYNAAYLSEGRHTIKLAGTVGGIYLFRFTTEKLENDPVYEFAGSAATVMHTGMNTDAEIDGEFRVLDANDTVSFKMNNVYEDPKGMNEYLLKLAVNTADAADAAVDIQIGETRYENIPVGGANGSVNCGTIVLPEGESEIVITAKTNGVKLKSLSIIEGTITTNETGNTLLPIIRATSISDGITPDATGSASFTAEQFIEFDVNVVAEGTYTLCMNAKSPQTGFTVYADGEDYTDSQYLELSYAESVTKGKNSTLLKNAGTNIEFTQGMHKIKVVFHDVDEAFTHVVNSIYLKRIDKTVSSTERIQLGTWDYKTINTKPYWNLPAQIGQGATLKGDELYNNIIFMGDISVTYEFNVAETGFYKISNFGNGPADATQMSSYALDGGTKQSETEFKYIGTSGNDIIEHTYRDYAYLTAGKHTLTIYATKPSKEPVRMNMTQIVWVTDVSEIKYDAESQMASYAVSNLNVEENGTLYIAAYKNNQLVGINAVDVTADTKAIKLVTYSKKAPDTVKVFALNENLKPIMAAATASGEDLTK